MRGCCSINRYFDIKLKYKKRSVQLKILKTPSPQGIFSDGNEKEINISENGCFVMLFPLIIGLSLNANKISERILMFN